MVGQDLFVMGIDDPKTGYRQLHQLGEFKAVKYTHDALYKTAVREGLNKDVLFMLPFPPDDEVVEKLKLTKSFLQWLNEETKPLLLALQNQVNIIKSN